MSEADARRVALLRDLVELTVPASDSQRALRGLPWDADELVELGVSHVLAVLRRFSAGELDAAEVVAWADAVDLRDDIGRTTGEESVVNDVLLEISSPEIFDELAAAAPGLISRLEAATR